MAAGRARSQPRRGTRRHAPASSARTARGARMTRTDTAWCSGQSVGAHAPRWDAIGTPVWYRMVQVWVGLEGASGVWCRCVGGLETGERWSRLMAPARTWSVSRVKGTRTPSWYGMVQVCRNSGVTVGVRVRVRSFFEHTCILDLFFCLGFTQVYDFTIRHNVLGSNKL